MLSPKSSNECSTTTNEPTKITRTAQYLVEFKCLKLRLTLPSRRKIASSSLVNDPKQKQQQPSNTVSDSKSTTSNSQHQQQCLRLRLMEHAKVTNNKSDTWRHHNATHHLHHFISPSNLLVRTLAQNNRSKQQRHHHNSSKKQQQQRQASNNKLLNTQYLEHNFEYVYFNDLFQTLCNLLDLIQSKEPVAMKNTDDEDDENDGTLVNYRCMIYHNDMLCFNLFIRYDGKVYDTAMEKNENTNMYSITIAPATKVFDQSLIYLFKETCNFSHLNGIGGGRCHSSVIKPSSHPHQSSQSQLHTTTTTTTATTSVLPPPPKHMQVKNDDDDCCVQFVADCNHKEWNTKERVIVELDDLSDDKDDEDDDEVEEMMAPNLDLLPHATCEFSLSTTTDDFLSTMVDDGNSLVITFPQSKQQQEQHQHNNTAQHSRSNNECSAKMNASTIESNSNLMSEDDCSFEVVVVRDSNNECASLKQKVDVKQNDNDGNNDDHVTNDKTEQQLLSNKTNVELVQTMNRKRMNKPTKQTLVIASSSSSSSSSSTALEQQNNETPDKLSSLLNKMPLSDIRRTSKYIREHLLLQSEDISKRKQLVKRMEQILIEAGFNCRMHIFGSTKNCLGLRGTSDIDIFIELRDSLNRKIDESHISYGKIQHVLRRVERILCQNRSYLAVLTGDARNGDVTLTTICRRHMRVPLTRLKIYLNSWTLELPVPSSSGAVTEFESTEGRSGCGGGGQVPPPKLINDTEPEQVLQCDFNVNNALGIANTRFIRFLCKFEPRFFVLNVLLRYWSKYVAGLNRPDALSSYALTNMILYYLQTRDPPILPPVDYFVKLSPKPKIVNDWRCDFCKDRSCIEFRTTNTETIGTLLVGFFTFYNRFNFLAHKISTRHGCAWKLRNIGGGNNRRQQQGGGGRNRGGGADKQQRGGRGGRGGVPLVHIMDPFEQNHNLTSRMMNRSYELMCEQFKLAEQRYRQFVVC